MTRLTKADFAAQAALIARQAADWSGEVCTMPDHLGKPMPDDTLARFIKNMRERLDHLWLWDLQWEPAALKEGEPGASFANPRTSKRYPGLYVGRCNACHAFNMAKKRTPFCDECEDRRDAAIAERRSALARAIGGEESDA